MENSDEPISHCRSRPGRISARRAQSDRKSRAHKKCICCSDNEQHSAHPPTSSKKRRRTSVVLRSTSPKRRRTSTVPHSTSSQKRNRTLSRKGKKTSAVPRSTSSQRRNRTLSRKGKKTSAVPRSTSSKKRTSSIPPPTFSRERKRTSACPPSKSCAEGQNPWPSSAILPDELPQVCREALRPRPSPAPLQHDEDLMICGRPMEEYQCIYHDVVDQALKLPSGRPRPYSLGLGRCLKQKLWDRLDRPSFKETVDEDGRVHFETVFGESGVYPPQRDVDTLDEPEPGRPPAKRAKQ